jgi:Fe-S-cluster-containing hydrogenase component 2
MSSMVINLSRCDSSPVCPVRRVCPSDAVYPVPGGFAIDPEKCDMCGSCLRVCPMGAVGLAKEG